MILHMDAIRTQTCASNRYMSFVQIDYIVKTSKDFEHS